MSNKKVDISVISDWGFLILNTVSAIFTIGSVLWIDSKQPNNGIVKILILCMLLTIVCFGVYICKLNNRYNNKILKVSEMFHKMNHYIRDEAFEISYYNNNGKLTKELLNQSFSKIVEYSVDSLSDMLNIITNKQVHICIKCFADIKENILDSKVESFARSKNTPTNRLNNKLVKVSEVTDYNNILTGDNHYYNEDILNDKNYKNTYICTNKYRTKIVVPIRVKLYDNSENYDIKGFICADCETPMAFKKKFDICLSLMRGIADDLCGYFNDNQKYMLNIKEQEVDVVG